MRSAVSSDFLFVFAAVLVIAVTGYIQYKKSRGGARLPTARQIQLVHATWASVQGLGLQAVGILLFETLFEQQPGALALFPRFNQEPNMFGSSLFKAHVLGVVTTVDTAIGMLNDVGATLLGAVLTMMPTRGSGAYSYNYYYYGGSYGDGKPASSIPVPLTEGESAKPDIESSTAGSVGDPNKGPARETLDS
jgi:hypothetical protein